MLDGQLHLLSDEITFHHASDWPAAPHGSGHPALAPYGAFPTADEPIVIAAVGVEKFWHNLLRALDLQHLAKDERFTDNAARAANRDVLDDVLGNVLRQRSRDEWLAMFEAEDVPAAPVLLVGDAVATPHVEARDLVVPMATAEGREAMVPRNPIRERGESRPPPLEGTPALDAHRRAILRDLLHYADEDVARLARAGAFGTSL